MTVTVTSVDGAPAAAYRYTESRMSKIAMKMLEDIKKDTVDFVPNFDDNSKEPTVLPSRYPNLLVNGSSGIAVGMATNIPPHNMNEVVEGMCCLIDNPDASLEEIMQYIKGPDFPTAGIIMGTRGIKEAYATGRGKIYLRARAEIIETKGDRYKIVVTEIPYGVNKARLITRIADLVKEKRLEDGAQSQLGLGGIPYYIVFFSTSVLQRCVVVIEAEVFRNKFSHVLILDGGVVLH